MTQPEIKRSGRSKEGDTDFANRVISVTERRVLLDVRHKFTTMPAPDFHKWLMDEIERVHR